jgi:hypothetical protein
MHWQADFTPLVGVVRLLQGSCFHEFLYRPSFRFECKSVE